MTSPYHINDDYGQTKTEAIRELLSRTPCFTRTRETNILIYKTVYLKNLCTCMFAYLRN